MKKNHQYIVMSITGILLMAGAAGTFDPQPDIVSAYVSDYDEFDSDGFPDDSIAEDDSQIRDTFAEHEGDTAQMPDDNIVSADSDIEQAETWANQLVAIDEENPNDTGRITAYQQLINQDGNPYAPILLANTQVNRHGKSREVDVYEGLLDSYRFDRESLNKLEELAERGSSQAMYLLGVYNYQTRHYEQARGWLEQAANYGNSNAMNQLAWVYREGLGVAEDMSEAVIWHRRAAEAGSARAMTNVGYLYSIGAGVEKDLDVSAYWYQKAADLNSAAGFYAVALYHLNGRGEYRQDTAEGVRLLLKSAELGHKRAMYAVGRRYENGDGLKQDMGKAVYWYKKAAELGEADAIAALRQFDGYYD